VSTARQSYTYEIDRARKRIHVRAHTALDRASLVAIIDRQLQDNAWSFGVLYDVRHVVGATSAADTRAVSAHALACVERHGPRGPVAIVTRSAEMVGAGQMYALVNAEAMQVEVFWDVDDADRWLDEQRAVRSS
jgi:hypothetical protein